MSQTPTPAPDDDAAPHAPADDSEVVYYQGGPMLRGDIGALLLYGFIAVVLFAAPELAKRLLNVQHVSGWVWLACILLGIIIFIIPLLKVKMLRYRISNYRIDYERGLLSKTIDTIELWHVEDVRFHQTLFDRILNVGTITVISRDETTPRLELHNLPNPRPLFEQIKQRIISVKRQRGVIKMDVG